MFIYKQSTGEFTDAAGKLLATGYSGNGASMNNPADQEIPMHGPIPQGYFTIGEAHTDPKLGPLAMRLTPDSTNEMYGRAGFFIHGDNAEMDHTASEGCIILPRGARIMISSGEDKAVKVEA